MLLSLALTACGGAKFVNTWTDPTAEPVNWQGKKIAAFVMTLMKDTREGAEGSLARELTERGAQGIAGYTIIPKEAEQDEEMARRMLAEAGISGAVIMRVVGMKDEVVSTPANLRYMQGPYYPTFWGYWGYSWHAIYEPGAVGTRQTVMIETLVYSIDQNKLLWAGTSKATNPGEAREVINKLVDDAGKEIRKAGLVTR
jgi:hypothetical protein